jgi:hypothetical protein
LLFIVERVVEPGDASRRIAERRMDGDVLNPLAIDVDLAAVLQAFQVLPAGKGPRRTNDILWLLPFHFRSRDS